MSTSAEFIHLYDIKLPRDTIAEVGSTLRSGWLSTGPKVAAFEKAVAAESHVRYGVAVNSGTAGMLVTLSALGIGEGCEVITTPFSFVATSEAIIRVGARPVFADIDPVSLTVDPEEVARKVTDRTACILPVDLAGYPCDYDRLRKVANYHGLPLVCDAAHSFGVRYRRKSIPQVTDASVYSFHATKNLTCGEGGMVMSRHKILADRVRLLSLHGLTSNAYQRREKSRWRYDVETFGYKANMSDVHASIGLGQLRHFDSMQEKRRRIAARYMRNLADLSEWLALPAEDNKRTPAWHLFIIRLHLSRLRISRNRFVDLMKTAGVECGVHYIPLYELTAFAKTGLRAEHFPNTTYAGSRVVTLPMYPGLTMAQVDRVCECIRDIVGKNRR